jgi:hypothetical protein
MQTHTAPLRVDVVSFGDHIRKDESARRRRFNEPHGMLQADYPQSRLILRIFGFVLLQFAVAKRRSQSQYPQSQPILPIFGFVCSFSPTAQTLRAGRSVRVGLMIHDRMYDCSAHHGSAKTQSHIEALMTFPMSSKHQLTTRSSMIDGRLPIIRPSIEWLPSRTGSPGEIGRPNCQ